MLVEVVQHRGGRRPATPALGILVEVVDGVVEPGVLALEDAHVLGQLLARAGSIGNSDALLLGHVRAEDDEELLEVLPGGRVVAGSEMAADVPAELAQPVVLVHQPGDRGEVTAAAVVAHRRRP